MNAVNERRWRQFKSNKRGYYSTCAFLLLFGISLFAEFIANNQPIVMEHQGQLWFPVLADYTEQELGGELPIPAQYADPYLQDLVRESDGWM
ncbi:MAG: ABC transporter permease, partial [Pseudomonadales bacterium]